jgi:hypothetical protein
MGTISMLATRPALRARTISAIAQLRAQHGQATSESAVLLFTVCVVATGAGGWLMNSHPAWLNALSIHIHSFYYLLSLPFP